MTKVAARIGGETWMHLDPRIPRRRGTTATAIAEHAHAPDLVVP